MKFRHEPGDVFSRLTLVKNLGPRPGGGGDRWELRCECGKTIVSKISHIRNGKTRSCGCFGIERRSGPKPERQTHGLSHSPEYRSWSSMKSRCSDPNNPKFPLYGARGIRVCDRWLSFENFFADMGPRPSDGHSVDRVNSNGDYEPSNCRWATDVEQNNNRSCNRIVDVNGRKQTVTQWAREAGVHEETIRSRLRAGWSADRAVFTPPTQPNSRKKKDAA